MGKHYPDLDLDMLSSGMSTSGDDSGSSGLDEGGKAMSPLLIVVFSSSPFVNRLFVSL